MNKLIKENFDSRFRVRENRDHMNFGLHNSQLLPFQQEHISRMLLFIL